MGRCKNIFRKDEIKIRIVMKNEKPKIKSCAHNDTNRVNFVFYDLSLVLNGLALLKYTHIHETNLFLLIPFV